MSDRELMQKALVHMGLNQHAVADQAPHRDVMAYNETMEELRAALEQQAEPVALIRDGVLCWHIPNPHYSRPAWAVHGTHMLYTAQAQRKPLTPEDRSSIVNEALRGHASTRDAIDWAIRHVERHHGIGEKP